MGKMKQCKDCRWHGRIGVNINNTACVHEKSDIFKFISPLDDSMAMGRETCIQMRERNGKCGWEARLWEKDRRKPVIGNGLM